MPHILQAFLLQGAGSRNKSGMTEGVEARRDASR